MQQARRVEQAGPARRAQQVLLELQGQRARRVQKTIPDRNNRRDGWSKRARFDRSRGSHRYDRRGRNNGRCCDRTRALGFARNRGYDRCDRFARSNGYARCDGFAWSNGRRCDRTRPTFGRIHRTHWSGWIKRGDRLYRTWRCRWAYHRCNRNCTCDRSAAWLDYPEHRTWSAEPPVPARDRHHRNASGWAPHAAGACWRGRCKRAGRRPTEVRAQQCRRFGGWVRGNRHSPGCCGSGWIAAKGWFGCQPRRDEPTRLQEPAAAPSPLRRRLRGEVMDLNPRVRHLRLMLGAMPAAGWRNEAARLC